MGICTYENLSLGAQSVVSMSSGGASVGMKESSGTARPTCESLSFDHGFRMSVLID